MTDASKVTRVVHTLGDQTFTASRPQVAKQKADITDAMVKDPVQLLRLLRNLDQSIDDASLGPRTLPCLGGSYHRDIAFVGGTSTAGGADLTRRKATDSNTKICWTFDESAGVTTFANSGAGGTLDLVGTGTYGTLTSGYTGLFGSCVDNLHNSGGKTADTSVGEGSTAFSVSAWVKLRSFAVNAQIVNKKYQTGATWANPFFAWDLHVINTSGDWAGSVTVSGTRYFAGSRNSSDWIPVNVWTLLAFTYDGSNLRSYIDGSLTQTVSCPGTIDNGSHGSYAVGANTTQSSDPTDGKVDDIRIETVVRDGAYLLGMYKAGIGRPDGTITFTTTTTDGTPVTIDHGLPGDVGWIPVRMRPRGARIYETSQGSGKLTLVSDATCMADIWVWPEPSAR